MELIHLNQIELVELQLERIDYLIVTSGNQPRCHFLAEKLHNIARNKILLTTGEEEQKKEWKNLPIFAEYGFNQHKVTRDDASGIDRFINEIVHLNSHHINIVVDYSCMPKKWYALLIDNITKANFRTDKINLYLSYTPKVFEKHRGKNAIDYFGPIISNRDKLRDNKPVSMIASLDMHHHSVQEAISKVKPKKFLAFVPNCRHDPEYAQHVIENNKSLLDRLDSNHIINYDAGRPEEINTLLTSYCLDERLASEVMILPQGPKTFSMMSMLLSVRYPDVKLWEVILKDQKISQDHGHPAANPIIVKVSFVSDELD